MKRISAILLTAAMLVSFMMFFASAKEYVPEGLYSEDETVTAIVIASGDPSAYFGESGSAEAVAREAKLNKQHSAIFKSMRGEQIEYETIFNYTRLLNGFAVKVKYGQLDKISQINGVEEVYVAGTYSISDDSVYAGGSGVLMGSDAANALGYSGEGTVIAIIDTGLNLSHEAFDDYGLTEDVLTSAYVGSLIENDKVLGGKYISHKIPFAYDYADSDNDVTDGNGHGTHVAGIAGGYAEDTLGQAVFSGAAPASQLVIMKVFEDNSGKTSSAVYFKALEDAYTLGVDVINMSLGVPAGYTYDRLLDEDLFGNIYARLEKAGIIVCVAAGNDGSQGDVSMNAYRSDTGIDSVTADYADYGLISNPATISGNLSVAAAGNTDNPADGIFMAGFSSMGVTSDISFGPSVTGIGVNVMSAGINSPDAYVSKSGTSMATPGVTGNMALILQYLKKTYPEMSKSELAATAEALAESTALILNNGEAAYTPRKQGSGLINSEKAVTAEAYIVNPIESLGDDKLKTGNFEVKLLLKNRSDGPVQYYIGAELVSDGLVIGSDNGYENNYNLTTSVSLKADTDYSINTGYGSLPVTVPAGGSTEITVKIRLTDSFKEYLDAYFTNGAFVDGFITLSDPSGEVAAHKSFINFYGDWSDGRMLEEYSLDGLLTRIWELADGGMPLEDAKLRALTEYQVNIGYNEVYAYDLEMYMPLAVLGENIFGETFTDMGEVPDLRYDASHMAITPGGAYGRISAFYAVPALLRNTEHIIMTVTDAETGELYYFDDTPYAKKTCADDGQLTPSSYFVWDGTDADGIYLENGVRAKVEFFAYLDVCGIGTLDQSNIYEEINRAGLESQWTFYVDIDTEGPEILDAEVGYSSITFTVKDNKYIAYAEISNGYSVIASKTFSKQTEGAEGSFSVDRSKLLTGGFYRIDFRDFASNETTAYMYLDSQGEGHIFDSETGFCVDGDGYWCSSDGVLAAFDIDDELKMLDVYFTNQYGDIYINLRNGGIEYPIGYAADLAESLGYGLTLWFGRDMSTAVEYPKESTEALSAADDPMFSIGYLADGTASRYIIDLGADCPATLWTVWDGFEEDSTRVYINGGNGVKLCPSYSYDKVYKVLSVDFEGREVISIINLDECGQLAEYYARLASDYADSAEAAFARVTELSGEAVKAAEDAEKAKADAVEAMNAADVAKRDSAAAAEQVKLAKDEVVSAKARVETVLNDVNSSAEEINKALEAVAEAEEKVLAAETTMANAKRIADEALASAEAAKDEVNDAVERLNQTMEKLENITADADRSEAAAQEMAEKVAEMETLTLKMGFYADSANNSVTRALAMVTSTNDQIDSIIKSTEESKAKVDEALRLAEEANLSVQETKAGIENAAKLADEAKTAAEQAREDARAAMNAAEQAKSDAESAKTAAELAKAEAEQAKADAEQAKSGAEQAKAEAEQAKSEAEANAKQAAEEKAAAEQAKLNAEQAEADAQSKVDEMEKIKSDLQQKLYEAESIADGLRAEAEAKGCRSGLAGYAVAVVLVLAFVPLARRKD